MYRHEPLIARVLELRRATTRSARCGRSTRASRSRRAGNTTSGSIASLGGGSLWDIGCYPVSAALVAGAEPPVEAFGWATHGTDRRRRSVHRAAAVSAGTSSRRSTAAFAPPIERGSRSPARTACCASQIRSSPAPRETIEISAATASRDHRGRGLAAALRPPGRGFRRRGARRPATGGDACRTAAAMRRRWRRCTAPSSCRPAGPAMMVRVTVYEPTVLWRLFHPRADTRARCCCRARRSSR